MRLLLSQVTYRVVQVTDDQLEATADGTGAVSVVSAAAFAGAPQAVAQVGCGNRIGEVTRTRSDSYASARL